MPSTVKPLDRRAAETTVRSPHVARGIAWLVLLASALFLLTTGGTYPGIASVGAHVIGQVIAIVVLGGWCVLALARPSWRPSTPLLGPIAVVAAAYVASGVLSARPRLSFEPLLAGLGWMVAYLFLSRLLAAPWFRTRTAALLTAFAVVVAFGYVGQVFVEWWNWWQLVGRLAVPPLRPSFASLFLGSPNLIGTALVLVGPLAVAIAWRRRERRRVAVGLAVAAALATFLSGSRGAYVGGLIGGGVAFLLLGTRTGGLRDVARSIARLVRGRPVVLVPVIGFGVAGIALVPSLVARFAQGGGTLRVDLWMSALTIFAAHPVFGAGPGTWVQLKVAANPSGVPNLVLPHSHDVYVQAAAELGVVGLAAVGLLAIGVARRVWAGWRSGDAALSRESGAVVVSLTAIAGQSIFDNLVNLPFVVLVLVTLVAWVDGGLAMPSGSLQTEVPPSHRRRMLPRPDALVPIASLACLLSVTPRLAAVDLAAVLSQSGNEAALDGEWGAAYVAYEGARKADPGFTLYDLQTASALARIGQTDDAAALMTHAVAADPVAINVIGLAALEAQQGERERALAHVAQSRAFGVGDPNVALNAGLILESLGETDQATQAFADAIASDPALAGADLWIAPDRRVMKRDVMAAAESRVDALDAALVLAYGGNPQGALAALATQPDSSRRAVYVAVATWLEGHPSGAIEQLEQRLQRDPGDWYTAAWASRIARISGNVEAASRYARWATTVQADAAPLFISERSDIGAGFDRPTAALPGSYDWAVYLRPITPFLQQPSLVIIGLR